MKSARERHLAQSKNSRTRKRARCSSSVNHAQESPAPCGSLRRACGRRAECRLRGGKTRDRHAERRARHVIEPNFVAERDRCRIAAMLAANPELQRIARLAPALGRDANQLADAVSVERHERI